jgi:hypothetical protein
MGSAFHSPRPLVVRRTDLPSGGTAWLCPTCAANLWVYERLLVKFGGSIPWEIQRCFGNRIRALVKRGRTALMI